MALVLGITLFLAINNHIDQISSNENIKQKLGVRAKIVNLIIYPIKSCGAIELKSCKVLETGFEHDREWVLAQKLDQGWKMITQREFPSLILVKPSINKSYSSNDKISLTITAPNMPKLTLQRSYDKEPVYIHIWDDLVYGVDQGDAASEYFSKYLNIDVRLFVKHPNYTRTLNPKHSPASSLLDFTPQTGFADGFPFLILSQESVDAFVERSFTRNESKSVSYRNFRPNILVKGCTPFEEDNWLHIKIGKNHSFLVNSRCTRCEMTNNDPDIGRVPSNTTTTTLK